MKKLIILSCVFSVLLLMGCDPYDKQTIATPNGYDQAALQDTNFVAALKSGVSPLTIQSGQLGDSLAIVTVTSVPNKLDTAASISYALQLDTVRSFTTAKIIPSKFSGKAGSDVKVGYKALNDSLLAFNKTGNQFALYGRMLVYITKGSMVAMRTSSIMNLLATPMASVAPLFIVGNILGSYSWDPNNASYIMFRDNSTVSNTVYTYTTKFTAGEYKILVKLGDWTTAWSLNTSGKIVQMNNGANLKVTANGYQTMTFDTSTGTLTMTAFDASSASTYAQIGLAGAFTNWGAQPDVMLTKTDYDPHVWEASNVVLPAGELKFRANSDWSVSWGSKLFPYGKGNLGGGNITVQAGTYYVKFNDLTGHYVFYK